MTTEPVEPAWQELSEDDILEYRAKRIRSWWKALEKVQLREYSLYPLLHVPNQWAVIASGGSGAYIVTRTNPHCTRYYCQCPAGIRRNPCWHVAAVAMLPKEAQTRREYRDLLRKKRDLQEDYGLEVSSRARDEYVDFLQKQVEETKDTLDRLKRTLEEEGIQVS